MKLHSNLYCDFIDILGQCYSSKYIWRYNEVRCYCGRHYSSCKRLKHVNSYRSKTSGKNISIIFQLTQTFQLLYINIQVGFTLN